MKNHLIHIFLILALLAVGLTACTTKPNPVYLEGEEKEMISTQAEPYAQHILDGMSQNDYTLFKTDFDDAMSKAITEQGFATIEKTYAPLGKPISVELVNIEVLEPYYRVNYKVTYSEKAVTMTIVLPSAEPRLVSGLWFK